MRSPTHLRTALAAIAIATMSAGFLSVSTTAAHAADPTVPSQIYAPYWESYSGDDPLQEWQASGTQFMTAAFLQTATPGSCTVYWDGDTGEPVSSSTWGSDFATIQADGGSVIASFGGWAADSTGTDIADSCTSVSKIAAAYEKVITTYGINRIDLDVEDESAGGSLADAAGITRRNEAIATVEGWAAKTGRSIQFSYTLPINPTGLDSTVRGVLKNAVAKNAGIATVNAMTFDYYIGTKQNMAADTESAATALEKQLAGLYPTYPAWLLWSMIGVTEMPGVDDYGTDETFTEANAATVLNWAQAVGIGEISIWALERDNGSCPGESPGVDTCSGISQPTWYFSNAFEPFTN